MLTMSRMREGWVNNNAAVLSYYFKLVVHFLQKQRQKDTDEIKKSIINYLTNLINVSYPFIYSLMAGEAR